MGNYKTVGSLSGVALNQCIWPSINNEGRTTRQRIDGDTVLSISLENDSFWNMLVSYQE